MRPLASLYRLPFVGGPDRLNFWIILQGFLFRRQTYFYTSLVSMVQDTIHTLEVVLVEESDSAKVSIASALASPTVPQLPLPAPFFLS